MDQAKPASDDRTTDVIVLGAGLVGSALAAALGAHGITAVVIDPADPAVILAAGFDGRASAIASAPHRMLAAIGVTDRLAGYGCPIEGIRVSDGLARGALDFAADPASGVPSGPLGTLYDTGVTSGPLGTLYDTGVTSGPLGTLYDTGVTSGPLGTLYENRRLRAALLEAAIAAPGIEVRMKARATEVERGPGGVRVVLDSGETVRAPLLVAAEGRHSPSRSAAGINVARWRYDHVAIVTALHHAAPHDNIAYEIFYPAGPFALLPLLDDAGGHRSAIVWTVRTDQAPGMLKLSDRGFLAEAHAAMGGFLGPLDGLTARSSYPLAFHHAATITAERLALAGDAAHGIHPIAGQGVNVGFRDVATLVEVLVEGKRLGLDLGDAQLLARYQRWRSLDTLMVAAATDGLTRLFGIPGRGASAVRRAGLAAVQRLPALKRGFMAEARGESGAVPRLLQGLMV